MKLNFNELAELAEIIDCSLFGSKSNEELFKNLSEEINELKDALGNKTDNGNFESLKELGDVIFCIVSIAKQNNLEIAHALSLTITKLQERIKYGIKE